MHRQAKALAKFHPNRPKLFPRLDDEQPGPVNRGELVEDLLLSVAICRRPVAEQKQMGIHLAGSRPGLRRASKATVPPPRLKKG